MRSSHEIEARSHLAHPRSRSRGWAAQTLAASAARSAWFVPAGAWSLLAALIAALLAIEARGSETEPRPVEVAVSSATMQPMAGTFRGSDGHIQLTPPRVSEKPVVDGKLDDRVWQQAAVLDSFTHGRPIEGVLDSLGTTCLVMYDDQNLYIAFRADDDPKLVQAPIVPRDQTWQGDWVGVSIDTYHDQQRSLFLCANPLGIQMDGVDREGADSDMAPDFLYTSKGRVTERGYEVEMAIPFKTLRFPNHSPVTFGFNAIRDVRRDGTHMYWAPIRRDINSYHTQIGVLENITGVRPGRNIEVNPTLTGSQLGAREGSSLRYADPESRFGLGVKMGLTSNLIADVAITPDFSQVEADAGVADINERFAIFFSEKRPFFLEGSDYFSSPFALVYTRRIVDPLYGVKLTGKTGRTTVGLLHASDRSAGESIETLPNGANPYWDQNAFYNIARFKRDVLKNSFVGVMLADREHEETFNRLAAVDGRFSLRDKYTLSFQGVQGWSQDQDLREAIAGLSPAEQAALDPSLYDRLGDERQGTGWMLGASRDTRPLNAGFEVRALSPSFRADMGFIDRTNYMTFAGWFRPHLWSKGGTWYNAVHAPFYYDRYYDYGGDRMTDEVFSQVVEVSLPKNSGFGGEGARRFIVFNGVEFRDIYRGALWAWCERFKTVRAGITYVVGDQVVFAETVSGHDRRVSIWSDLRFSSQFDGSFNLESRGVWRADDTKFADALIPRLRLSYQFNRELAVRSITELQSRRRYDSSGALASKTQTLVPDLLVSYVLRPGTVMYLGYGSVLEGQDRDSLTPSRSSLFTKVSYLWQI
jgi:hypothetical protein